MDSASSKSTRAGARRQRHRTARGREAALRRAAWRASSCWQESLESRVMLAAEVMISEIMYHPGSGDAGDEYVEIHNRGDAPANLEGWQFTKGINYTFHGRVLGPGDYLVVAADLSRFQSNYPGVTNVIGGLWEGRLSNSGETIELEDVAGVKVDEVTYADEGDWAVRSRPVDRWQAPSSVARNNQTVTVELPYHGFERGDSVQLGGASEAEYNGTFVVTSITATTFTFTITDAPASPASGEIRVRQILDHGHAGWDWYQRADGWGSSLELVNPDLGNNDGQNWASSTGTGTPGSANSVASGDAAPLVLDARHYPAVPKPTAPVAVTARIVDESNIGLLVNLYWRTDGESAFRDVAMADDGLHGDGAAGDGVWGATIPAQTDGAIVQFYVTAADDAGHWRVWPAPAQEVGGSAAADGTFPMYQVDATPYSGLQPLFKLIMTEAERAELADIGSLPGDGIFEDESNAAMNGTFVSVEPGGDVQVRYFVGIRNRGAGSRDQQPNNYRVSFPTDRRWKGVTDINVNARWSMEEIAGSALFRQAGLVAQDAVPVQVRVNNANLAAQGFGMFGSYVWMEAEGDAFASNHFPTDDGGNYYRGVRRITTNQPNADLSYRGEDADEYRLDYVKQTNSEQDDYGDLIALVRAFSPTLTPGDDAFAAALAQQIDVTQWLRYFAATSLIGDMETTLGTGYGDDYSVYRGVADARFKLIVHDLDTILGRGDASSNPTRSIFQAGAGVAAIDRFLKSPTFAPQYYAQLLDLLSTTFDPANLKATLTNVLGTYVPADVIETMRDFAQQRKASVLLQIPRTVTATAPGLVAQDGYLRTAEATVNVTGLADVIDTRSVLVNGEPAEWVAWQGRWTLNGVALQPGINRIVVRAIGADGKQVATGALDVWRDLPPGAVGGTLPAGTTTWTAAGGPYHVTSDVVVPAGATLVVEPGTTVYFSPGMRLSVLGTLNAEGNADRRIRFSRVPGSTGGWNGIVLDYPTVIPTAQRPDNRIAFADIEFSDGGGEAIFADKANLYLDNLIFSNHTKQYVDVTDTSIVLKNSYFPGISTAELIHFSGFPTDGYALVEGNTFGVTTGYNDIIDFTGGQRPGPIAQFLNNTFLGGSDDALDLDGTDAHVEGNVFMNFHQDAARESKSHAVSTGTENGQLTEITIVRNFFYDVDHAILIKDGAFGTIVNNTIVKVYRIHADATTAAINLYEPRSGQWPGAGVYLENNIFQDVSAMFENPVTPGYDVEITVNNSIYPLIAGEPVWPGTGNYHGDPHLLKAADPTDLRRDFQLRPGGGPARGTGYNGADLGAAIPGGASIAGEPIGTTTRSSATLIVGGPDVHAYSYRINGGAWSGEIAVTNPGQPNHVIPPLQLTGLADGTYAVEVMAKNSAGFWQSESDATTSRTWTVDSTLTPTVRINEVIADNTAFPVNGRDRDMIELYNYGTAAVNLLGMSISDNPNSPRKYVFGDVTIQPGEHLVVYADNNDGTAGVHTGWSLSADGEGVHLYDTTGNGGARVDSVVFGTQLENLSIGRVGDEWRLTAPTFGAANVAQPTGDPSRLRINEWLASGADPFNNDFIEIWNPDSLPTDMGGLAVTDAPDGWPDRYSVPPLTFVGGSDHYVFTADDDPSQGADHSNFKLAHEQGLIALFGRDGQQIDRVLYGTQRPGVSQGRSPDGDGRFAFFTQPSPGAANPGTGQQPTTKTHDLVLFGSDWRYFETGVPANQGAATWKDPAYADSAWPSGAGLLYVESSSLPQPKRTLLTFGRTTYYFRTKFNLAADPSSLTSLELHTVLDDGAVIYVNGHEVARMGMPAAPAVITDATPADRTVDNATTETISLDDAIQYLVQGDNVIAVEVHQVEPDSSDIVWGGELKATQTVNPASPSPLQLRITEINYDPAGDGRLGGNGTDYEFIELQNMSGGRMSLDGVRFTAGVDFTFDGIAIEAGRRIVIVKNRDAFVGRYGNTATIIGEYGGSLDNSGGQIRLVDINGLLIHDFVYSRLWYPETDASVGHTLTIKDANADPGTWGDPASWRGSHFVHGFPGFDDNAAPALPGTVVISEVSSRGTGPDGDWIELYNATDGSVFVGGWLLSDSSGNTMKYKLPSTTTIPARGRLLLTEHADFGTTSDPGTVVPFSLDDLGGEVVLSSGPDGGFAFTGYRMRATFGAAEPGRSFVRHANSLGEVEYVPAASPTPGADDAAPAVGPVVISEVMYHPAGSNAHEFVELRNVSGAPVSLAGWRFTDGINFEFPQDAVIPDGVVVVVAPVAPDVFRAAYGLPATVTVFGPYTGALENHGEHLTLSRPVAPVNGVTPYALVDHVRYAPTSPWPTSPGGQGPSLNRVEPPAYGNEPLSWAAGPSGGTPGDGAVVQPIVVNGTPDADLFEVRVNPAGTHVEVLRGAEVLHALPAGTSIPVTINGLDGDDRFLVNFANGTPVLSGGLTIVGGAGGDTLAVAGTLASSALAFDDVSAIVGATVFVHAGVERVELAMPQAAMLSLGGNVEAVITGPGSVFSADGISMDAGAKLDLGNHDLLVKNGDLAAITDLVRTARNGGEVRWGGKGIGTSTAASLTGLAAIAQDADVLVKRSYDGDANADGRVNADDYFRIDSGFLDQPADPLYAQGDFNYDGTINADDYFLIDSAFLGQGSPMGSASPTAIAAARVSAVVATTIDDEPSKRSRKATSSLRARMNDTLRRLSRRRITGAR